MLWATQSRFSPTQWRVDTLWYGHYDGLRWSVPQVVAHGLPLRGTPGGASQLVRRGSRLYHAVPGRWSSSGAGVFVFIGGAGTWRASAFPVDGPVPAYVAIGTAGTTLVLAYVAADVEQASSDRNSVFVRTSVDQGVSWSPPLLVYRSGRAGAFEPHIVSSSSDTVQLAWAQRRPDGTGTELVAIRTSADGGVTWRTGAETDLGTVFDSFSAVPGTRHRGMSWVVRADSVVLEGPMGDSGRPRPVADRTLFPPSLARMRDGSLLAIVGRFNYLDSLRFPVSAFTCRAD